jgi:hypothetical protein
LGIDYYEVLDIAKTATTEQIKAAHRKLVRIAHPDQGGDAIQFRLVQEAYEILHDQAKRTVYDTANGMNHAAAPSAPESTHSEKPANARRQAPQSPPQQAPPNPPPPPRSPPVSGRTSPPRQPPRPATFPAPAFTPAAGHQWPRKPRRGRPRPVTVVFWLTAGLALGLVAFTMLALIADSMQGATSMNGVIAMWGIPAIGYAVWWLMGRPISRALAVWAHSYTVFMALCVALAFAKHDTGFGIFLVAEVASLVAVPMTGRAHRRRAR